MDCDEVCGNVIKLILNLMFKNGLYYKLLNFFVKRIIYWWYCICNVFMCWF